MEYTRLGRTNLSVSVVGLGCGGHSRLGQRTGSSREHSVSLVKQALDSGINLFDTAEAYGTEEIIAEAIKTQEREQIVLSTKKKPRTKSGLLKPGELPLAVEQSLRRLQVEQVDIFQMHGISLHDYSYVREELVPPMLRLQQQGKIRFLGISEDFATDPSHQMLSKAVQDDCWDVLLVGFNLLNQSARATVLAPAIEHDIGILLMHAVRRSLSDSARLTSTLAMLIEQGKLPQLKTPDELFELLLTESGADSLQAAAYRFCRHEPGVHVVLTGTGNPKHLEANVQSLLKPPLHAQVVQRLQAIFAGVNCVSGD